MYGAYKKGDKVYRTKLTSCFNMFYEQNKTYNLDSIEFKAGIDCSELINMSGTFHMLSYLTSVIGLEYLDISKVTIMNSMFNRCNSLTSLNISSWDTSNDTSMWGLFYNCQKLTSLDLSNFNTSKATNMDYMFSECSSLTNITVSRNNWNIISGCKTTNMFSGCGTSSVTYVD